MQHIHIVNQRLSSTQGPNIRRAVQCSTSKMLNFKRSSTQAPNIRGLLQCSTSTSSINVCSSILVPNVRGVLQYSTSAVPNERSSSRQAPNIRGVSQCSTFTLSIKDVVQHKRQMHEVYCNAAHPVAILRGGLSRPFPPRFFLGPPFGPSCFFLISRLSSFG